jgi:hypothetical protein
MPKPTAEQTMSQWCQAHLVHHSDFFVEEDDEKFIMTIKFCGSGSTVQRVCDGDRGRTHKAYPWSGDMKGMCYYCTHEPAWFRNTMFASGKEYIEYAQQFDENGQPTGKCCRYIIHKDKD